MSDPIIGLVQYFNGGRLIMCLPIVMIRILILAILLAATIPGQGQEILQTDKLPELVIQGSGEQNVLLIPCMGCRWNEWEEFMERKIEAARQGTRDRWSDRVRETRARYETESLRLGA